MLAIEYDGAYWHADRHEVDVEKSQDLLAAGYIVAACVNTPWPDCRSMIGRCGVHRPRDSPHARRDDRARVRQWAMSRLFDAP
ncbi:hypothetical protein [Streptomyces sp. 2RAF24]|uniref:hypothetical protein n=1 Tax=Streptomyces sp. 2RAF24 TaxID=3232997 RepID=UPI003F9B464E